MKGDEPGRSRVMRRRVVGAGVVAVVVGLGAVALLGPRSHPDHGEIVETFEVPSYRWTGMSGMAAQVQGTLALDGDCPVLVAEDTVGGLLVFPWALGVTYADGTKGVVHRWTGGVYAVEGGVVDAAGGWDEPGAEGEWQPVCEGSDLTANIVVNSWP